jgi:hypothetical protein
MSCCRAVVRVCEREAVVLVCEREAVVRVCEREAVVLVCEREAVVLARTRLQAFSALDGRFRRGAQVTGSRAAARLSSRGCRVLCLGQDSHMMLCVRAHSFVRSRARLALAFFLFPSLSLAPPPRYPPPTFLSLPPSVDKNALTWRPAFYVHKEYTQRCMQGQGACASTAAPQQTTAKHTCLCRAASSETGCPSSPTELSHCGCCLTAGVPAGDWASIKTAQPQPLGHLTSAPPPSSVWPSSTCRSASSRSTKVSKSSGDNKRFTSRWAMGREQPGAGHT